MKASIVDLRYKMKEVLAALKRNETVHILYHGKEAGIIIPAKSTHKARKITDHPLFGMSKKSTSFKSVQKEIDRLRAPRYAR